MNYHIFSETNSKSFFIKIKKVIADFLIDLEMMYP